MTKQLDFINYGYEKEPDIEILKKALENNTCRTAELKLVHDATQLKYQAMTAIPTTIEKTMSPEQLYNAGSPLWAREYTVYELRCYMRYKAPATYKMAKSIIKMDSVI